MTRIFMETDEQVGRLESLNSSYRTSSEIRDGRVCCFVQLVDNVTGAVWHEALGQSHQDALESALNTARAGSRPKTTAEIAAESIALSDENAKLRDLVEQLKARGSEPVPAQDESAGAPSVSRRRAT